LGQPLTRNILTPKKLVNYGDTIEVIFEKYNMKINLQVMARQSGKLGDKISLFNPKSKKMFTGKIVDFKKVMVDI
ncbi:MAG: flagella basal body P-ring formation protein FlgA, partial [Candidatus Magasanikbacteria bacterium CG10_big_fil_rev_8_21_14_0_10_38_6]